MMQEQAHQEQPSGSGTLRGTVFTVVVHGIALLALAGVLVFQVPRYEETFRDARMTLPRLTMVVISLSSLTKQYLLLLLPPLLAADAAVCFVLRSRAATAMPSRLWSMAVIAVLLLVALLVVLGLYLPLRSLTDSLAHSA